MLVGKRPGPSGLQFERGGTAPNPQKRNVYNLWVHDDNFSPDELVINKDFFPSNLAIGDVLEVVQPGAESSAGHFDQQPTSLGSQHQLHLSDLRNQRSFGSLMSSLDLTPGPNKKSVLLQVKTLEKLPRQPQLQISVSKYIAELFELQARRDVVVQKVDPATVSAEVIQLSFRDQYLGRSDMWRLKESLVGSCVYVGKKLVFAGCIKAQVKEIRVNGQSVSCGYVTDSTTPVYRSESAKYFIFLQMSREMWLFDEDGELYFEKAVDGFLPELFRRWKALGTNHVVSIILFSRVFYDQESVPLPSAVGHGRSHKPSTSTFDGGDLSTIHGRPYKDFYKVLVDWETRSDWSSVIQSIKQELPNYQRQILQREHLAGSALSPMPLPKSRSSSLSEVELEAAIKGAGPGATLPGTGPDANTASAAAQASSQPGNWGILGANSSAAEGNVLEAVNLALNIFDKHYVDRDLSRTGLSIVVVTPGTGYFDVSADLARITKQRMVDNGIGLDIVCLSRPPLFQVPLFHLINDNTKDSTASSAFSKPGSSRSIGGGGGAGGVSSSGMLSNLVTIGIAPTGGAMLDGSRHDLMQSDLNPSTRFSLPHWIDISFYNEGVSGLHSTPSAQTASLGIGHDESEERFVPRCRMYEVQMMGDVESGQTFAKIPGLFIRNDFKQSGLTRGLQPTMDDRHDTYRRYDRDVFGSDFFNDGVPGMGLLSTSVTPVGASSPMDSPLASPFAPPGSTALEQSVLHGPSASILSTSAPSRTAPLGISPPADGLLSSGTMFADKRRRVVPTMAASGIAGGAGAAPASQAPTVSSTPLGGMAPSIGSGMTPLAALPPMAPGVLDGSSQNPVTSLVFASTGAHMRGVSQDRSMLILAGAGQGMPSRRFVSTASSSNLMTSPSQTPSSNNTTPRAKTRARVSSRDASLRAGGSVRGMPATLSELPYEEERQDRGFLTSLDPPAPLAFGGQSTSTAPPPLPSSAMLSRSPGSRQAYDADPPFLSTRNRDSVSNANVTSSPGVSSNNTLTPFSVAMAAAGGVNTGNMNSNRSSVTQAHPSASGLIGMGGSTALSLRLPSARSKVNPCNPQKSVVRMKSYRRRWHYTFATQFDPLVDAAIMKWTSLCTPACMPLTTDFLPDLNQLTKNDSYKEYTYTLSLNEEQRAAASGSSSGMSDSVISGPASSSTMQRQDFLLTELISQRLAQGFQLIIPPLLTSSSSAAVAGALSGNANGDKDELSNSESGDMALVADNKPGAADAASLASSRKESGASVSSAYRRDWTTGSSAAAGSVGFGRLSSTARPNLGSGKDSASMSPSNSRDQESKTQQPQKGSGPSGSTSGLESGEAGGASHSGLMSSSRSVAKRGEAKPFYLSMGHTYHELLFDSAGKNVMVKRYMRRESSGGESLAYTCHIWPKYRDDYHPRSLVFSYPDVSRFNWNYLDHLVAGYYDELIPSLRYWRTRFLLLPMDPLPKSMSFLTPHNESLNEEELRLAGFLKFVECFQRARWLSDSWERGEGKMKNIHPSTTLHIQITALPTSIFVQEEMKGSGHVASQSSVSLLSATRSLPVSVLPVASVSTGDAANSPSSSITLPIAGGNQKAPGISGSASGSSGAPGSSTQANSSAYGQAGGVPPGVLSKQSHITSVVAAMNDPEAGLVFRDRRWHFRVYRRCVVGNELVDWLIRNFSDVDTREDAVEFLNSLMDKGVLVHVRRKHRILDGHYFYQIHAYSEGGQAGAVTTGSGNLSTGLFGSGTTTAPVESNAGPSAPLSEKDRDGADSSATSISDTASMTTISSASTVAAAAGGGGPAGMIKWFRSNKGGSISTIPPGLVGLGSGSSQGELGGQQPSSQGAAGASGLTTGAASSGAGGPSGGRSDAPRKNTVIELSKRMAIDCDPLKKSDRREWAILHYDTVYNPSQCYHFQLHWLVCTARLIDDLVQTWARKAAQCGLLLVEAPVEQAKPENDDNPFQSPVVIRLSVRPPSVAELLARRHPSSASGVGASPSLTSIWSATQLTPNPQSSTAPPSQPPTASSVPGPGERERGWSMSSSFAVSEEARAAGLNPKHFEEELLKSQGFILDFEADSRFKPGTVRYSFDKTEFRHTQYIHRSGLAFVQILDAGGPHGEGFLWINNRLLATHLNNAGTEALQKNFADFCSNVEKLQVFWQDATRRLQKSWEEAEFMFVDEPGEGLRSASSVPQSPIEERANLGSGAGNFTSSGLRSSVTSGSDAPAPPWRRAGSRGAYGGGADGYGSSGTSSPLVGSTPSMTPSLGTPILDSRRRSSLEREFVFAVAAGASLPGRGIESPSAATASPVTESRILSDADKSSSS